MKNYIHDGNTYPFIVIAAVMAGAVIVLGDTIVVAKSDGAIGELIATQATGVVNVSKLSTDAVAQGVKLYWDVANSRITTTVGSNKYAGKAFEASAAGVTTVNVDLNA